MPTIYLTQRQLQLAMLCLEFHVGSGELSENTGIPDADNLLNEVLGSIKYQTGMLSRDKIFQGTIHFLSTAPMGHKKFESIIAKDDIDAKALLSQKYPDAWQIDVREL